MCTMVYLGSKHPFELGPPQNEGAVAPAPADKVPHALKSMPYIAMLTSWHEGRPYCSCAFIEKSLPWEAADEDPETIAAFDVLRRLAEIHGADLRVFGADDDETSLEPNVHCRLAPQHLHAGLILFNIPFNGPERPRVIVDIVPGLEAPEKPDTLE